jgi:hypothetical protein
MRTGWYRHVVVALVFLVTGCSHGGGASFAPHNPTLASSSLQCGVIPLSNQRKPNGIGPCCNISDGDLCMGAVNIGTAPGIDQYPYVDGCDSLNSGFSPSGGLCYGMIDGGYYGIPIGIFRTVGTYALYYGYDGTYYYLDVANPLGAPNIISASCTFQSHNPNNSGTVNTTFNVDALRVKSLAPLAANARTSCTLRSGSQSWTATGIYFFIRNI